MISGYFCCKLLQQRGLKAPRYYLTSIWTYNFSIMGEPNTLHFYNFGTFEQPLFSHNQLLLSLETPGYHKKPMEIAVLFLIWFKKISKSRNSDCLTNLEKTGAGEWWRSVKQSQTSWIWDQCLSTTWNENLRIRNEYFTNTYFSETKKPRNEHQEFENRKTRNRKPINLKLFIFN